MRALRALSVVVADIVGPAFGRLRPDVLDVQDAAKQQLDLLFQCDSPNFYAPLLSQPSIARNVAYDPLKRPLTDEDVEVREQALHIVRDITETRASVDLALYRSASGSC